MFSRMTARALLVAPVILCVGFSTLATGAVKQVPTPTWTLTADGATEVVTKPGDIVTFTLRGQQLVGATAVLAITKNTGALETLPLLSPKANLPLVIKFQIPKGNGIHGLRQYVVKVMGRTKSGQVVESNQVTIRWQQ